MISISLWSAFECPIIFLRLTAKMSPKNPSKKKNLDKTSKDNLHEPFENK